jgi:hypothetical protein
MVKVDPFVAPIPRKILNDPELRPFFEYFIRWAHDIWIRTGGGSDDVESTQNRDVYDSTGYAAQVWEIKKQLECLSNSYEYVPENSIFNTVSVSRNYTCAPFDFVNAEKKAEITLPQHGECVVRNADSSKIKIKSTKKINGHSQIYINKKGTALHFKYFPQDDEWFFV